MTDWVLHDFLQVNGGAERLVLTLAAGLPGFSLGVSGIYSEFSATGDLMGLRPKVPSWTRGLPRVARAIASFAAPAFPIQNSERVVYSGLYAPLAVQHQRAGRKIYYCHTPPRFAFGETDDYLARVAAAFRPALSVAIERYRRAYLSALERMDIVLANSAHVARKLAGLNIHAEVLYPPVDVDSFKWLGQDGYYLSVGRLEPNKRIDNIVRAFMAMPDKKLIVVSGGSQFGLLSRMTEKAPNISITGWVDDAALAQWIGGAIAVIYVARDEDFGISAVEAMAAGKPVIAADEGGLRESVVDGKTGILIEPTAEAIAAAVRRLDGSYAQAMRDDCERRAALFSRTRFLRSISRYCEV